MQNNRAIRYFYVRDENHNPYGCIAYYREPSSTLKNVDKVYYSYSFCSRTSEDTFKRDQARELAAGRLFSPKASSFEENQSVTGRAFNLQLLAQVMVSDKIPQGMSRLAQKMLDRLESE